MGVVYQARRQQLNRLVALKMIRAGIDATPGDRDRDRFRVEAEAAARLRHANILQIYDIGEAAGLPFVALELLEGGSLADRLAGTPQPGRQAAVLMVTLARTIHAAHRAGIVHRDLKPSNVLFDREGTP
jgi:serine/threonine protein kinase